MNLKRRRWLVPEVVQTSAMDCGPAALKCLLEGFGIPVSYGRLREACQTEASLYCASAASPSERRIASCCKGIPEMASQLSPRF
jgi:ABC-type bacteriocin/lantibiotic exporter with double-glycine peptidase domain